MTGLDTEAVTVLTGANTMALIVHAFGAMRAAGRMEAKLEALDERVRRMEKHADQREIARFKRERGQDE